MVCYEEERFPQGKGSMDPEMHVISFLFSLGEWTFDRNLNSPLEEGQERFFVLAVDPPATCTSQACSNDILRGFQKASYPKGSPQPQYADDTTFFREGFVEVA